ncbi:MAG: hypothetical protein MI919_37495 [Holophagales bacterium]|nr:hypothetical protein [Holophagales bacterium]
MNIDWSFPEPRTGLPGVLDRFIGPGATRAELILQVAVPSVMAVLAPLYASLAGFGWTWGQLLFSSLLAFDIAGGVLTNATSSAKRWFHRPGQRPVQHLGFVGLHLVHLTLVSWLYLELDLGWVLAAGGYLLLAAMAVLAMPRYLQRPVGLLGYAGGLLLALYGLLQPAGLEWFLPLFYLKLLVSHLLVEEPYRPEP